MKCIIEYTSSTPPSELYTFLAKAVVEEEITSFSALMDFIEPLPRDARLNAVIPQIFKLIRKLHWGFFKDVAVDTYPKVWKEIVIPHPEFKTCGDLKRNLTISNVYVGILDIHGYTRFCEKNKNNLSMLQMLDDIIQVDILKIAKKYNVVFQRRQGDEIVLVGASAADVLAVTLLILECFAKRRTFNVKENLRHRSGYKIILEEMHVSAGIAGGKKFTPFIITKDGDLSGGVINTAARLQGRANELSSSSSRILVSRTVYTSFLAEMKAAPNPFFEKEPIKFFDSGWINFKGMTVAVHEVLFTEAQFYKLQYEPQMTELYKAIDSNSWKDGIFNNLLTLLIKIFRSMPAFKIETIEIGRKIQLSNEDCIRLSNEILQLFRVKQDYRKAIHQLERLVELMKTIPQFDRLCMEYAGAILHAYSSVLAEYNNRIETKIEEKAPQVLPQKYRTLYEEGRRGAEVYQRLRERLYQTLTPLEISLIWSNVIDQSQHNLEVYIHSGKQEQM
jgi:class 3 adenylate cyclase